MTTLEFDPSFIEDIEHLNAWRRVPSARFEWQLAIEQPKEIDANQFKMILESMRMISFI